MGSTKAAYIESRVKERLRRLNTKPPYIQRNMNITESNAIRILSPLKDTIVSTLDMNFALSVLEQVYAKNTNRATTVAQFIANELAIGLYTYNGILDTNAYDIGDNNRSIIETKINEAGLCQRIINNQETLTKRFNVDAIATDPKLSIRETVSKMCELIDTYDIPDSHKYSVALENIIYTLIKNNRGFDEDSEIIDTITEYFLIRDGVIPDTTYKEYQELLEGFYAYDKSKSTILIEKFMDNDGEYFKQEAVKILSQYDDPIINFYCDPYKVTNESTAITYLEGISAIREMVSKSEGKEAETALLYTAKNVQNFFSADNDVIKFQRSQLFGDIEFDKITTDDLTIDPRKPIHEKPSKYSFSLLDQYKNIIEMSADEEINAMIAGFKAEQKKDVSLLKRFINKLYAKDPKDIINELPGVMMCIRLVLYVLISSTGPIGVVCTIFMGLINWLISNRINEKQCEKLIDYIRKETAKIDDKISKAEGKEKSDLEEYKRELNRAERKTIQYLQSIDTDHDDEMVGGSSDDIDLDDLNFETAIARVDSIMQLAENCIQVASNNNISSMEYAIASATEGNFLHDLSEMIYYSSYPTKSYIQDLKYVRESSDDIKIRTAITVEEDRLLNMTDNLSDIRRLIAEAVVDNVLLKESDNILQEKVNLNTFKLAIQNAKAKLKDLSTKEKSLWQSVDAHASGLVRSIEKAMTSDRREAIIKGNIIPKFSKVIKGSVALAGIGLVFSPTTAAITAIGALGVSSSLNLREKKLLMDEIDTELKVVEKQLEIAQNDGDMNQYRFLLNYQKKLTREYQRIRYGLKVQGRDIPTAVIPGRGGND